MKLGKGSLRGFFLLVLSSFFMSWAKFFIKPPGPRRGNLFLLNSQSSFSFFCLLNEVDTYKVLKTLQEEKLILIFNFLVTERSRSIGVFLFVLGFFGAGIVAQFFP